MSTNMVNSKHTHYRYNVLDKCFRRWERPFSFKELLDEVNEKIAEVYPGEGISTRTLRNDIKLFRDEEKGFRTILFVEKHKGEVYVNPNQTVKNFIMYFLNNKIFRQSITWEKFYFK